MGRGMVLSATFKTVIKPGRSGKTNLSDGGGRRKGHSTAISKSWRCVENYAKGRREGGTLRSPDRHFHFHILCCCCCCCSSACPARSRKSPKDFSDSRRRHLCHPLFRPWRSRPWEEGSEGRGVAAFSCSLRASLFFPAFFRRIFSCIYLPRIFGGKLSEPKNKYIPTYLKGKKYN